MLGWLVGFSAAPADVLSKLARYAEATNTMVQIARFLNRLGVNIMASFEDNRKDGILL